MFLARAVNRSETFLVILTVFHFLDWLRPEESGGSEWRHFFFVGLAHGGFGLEFELVRRERVVCKLPFHVLLSFLDVALCLGDANQLAELPEKFLRTNVLKRWTRLLLALRGELLGLLSILDGGFDLVVGVVVVMEHGS